MVDALATADAAEKLKGKDGIQFIIFGNGSEEANIRRRIAEKRLTNIQLFPLQPLDRISEVYSLGDVSIIPCKPGTGGSGMPSKTWTIMATGTAIIASFDLGGEMEQTINEADCGICVPAGNAEKLAEAIDELFRDRERTITLGDNARKFAVEKVSKEQAVAQYIELIEKVVNKQ